MNKSKLSLILAVAAAAAPATAAIVNESSGIVPVAFNPITNPGALGSASATPSNLLVDSFDGSLGTLVSVSYTLTYYSYAGFSVNNLSGSSSAYVISWALGYAVNLDNNVLTEPGAFNRIFNGALQAFGTGVIANGGTVGPTTTPVSTETYNNSVGAPLATYVGDGITDVTFVFTPTGFSSIGGASNPQGQANPQPTVFYAAKIDVVYTYTNEVPEPSTYAAGAVVLAGAGLILRRRMVAGKLN